MKKNSQIDEMVSYYDHRAVWHDEYMNYESIEKMEELFKPIFNLIEPLISGKSILEIASGTGNWTQALSRRAKKVTAIDSSQQSIKIAKEKFGKIENLSFMLSDAYTLDNIDGEFDAIFSADWFSHVPIPQIDSFISTLQTKVKPDTPIIFLDMLESQYFKEENSYLDNNGNRVSKRKLPNGEVFEVIKNFHSESALLKMFSKYGNIVRYTEFESLQRWMLDFKIK